MTAAQPVPMSLIEPVQDRWVQCDSCQKWRRITDDKVDTSGDQWFCYQNTDPAHASCDAPEEPSSDTEVTTNAPPPAPTQPTMPQHQPIVLPHQQTQTKKPGVGGGKKRRKKKRAGSDDEDEESSEEDSEDEAFYMAIDDMERQRRAQRERKTATISSVRYGDFGEVDMEDEGRKRRPSAKVVWSADQDDALLQAIVKHGAGNWTQMKNDPEFSARFGELKPAHLRVRWKKLESSDNAWEGGAAGGAGGGGAAAGRSEQKQEGAQQHLQQHQQQQQHAMEAKPIDASERAMEMLAHHRQAIQEPPPAGSSVSPHTGIPAPQAPFVAYRPYPTHLFDLPKKMNEQATGADLSVPMTTDTRTDLHHHNNLSHKQQHQSGKRMRKSKSGSRDDDSFSDESGMDDDDDDGDSHGRTVGAGGEHGGADKSRSEFRDLEANLDNSAYMYYYDHRDSSLMLYETYNIPLRDLYRQLTQQYGMKNQDALELMKTLGEARDLYSRRNMLAKAIYAHTSHFQQSQLVRQWIHAVRQMTTQHVHRQHDIKLRQEQENRMREKIIIERNKAQGHGHTHTAAVLDHATASYATSGLPASSLVSSSPHSVVRPPTLSPGLAALKKLPYYWKKKLEEAMMKGQPVPEVTGSTPQKPLLQVQLKAIAAEWNTEEMKAEVLRVPMQQIKEQQQHQQQQVQQQQQQLQAQMPPLPLPQQTETTQQATPQQHIQQQQQQLQQIQSHQPHHPTQPAVPSTAATTPASAAHTLTDEDSAATSAHPPTDHPMDSSIHLPPSSPAMSSSALPPSPKASVRLRRVPTGFVLTDVTPGLMPTGVEVPNIRLRKSADGFIMTGTSPVKIEGDIAMRD